MAGARWPRELIWVCQFCEEEQGLFFRWAHFCWPIEGALRRYWLWSCRNHGVMLRRRRIESLRFRSMCFSLRYVFWSGRKAWEGPEAVFGNLAHLSHLWSRPWPSLPQRREASSPIHSHIWSLNQFDLHSVILWTIRSIFIRLTHQYYWDYCLRWLIRHPGLIVKTSYRSELKGMKRSGQVFQSSCQPWSRSYCYHCCFHCHLRLHYCLIFLSIIIFYSYVFVEDASIHHHFLSHSILSHCWLAWTLPSSLLLGLRTSSNGVRQCCLFRDLPRTTSSLHLPGHHSRQCTRRMLRSAGVYLRLES